MIPVRMFLFLAICLLPFPGFAFNYGTLQTEASALRKEFSSGRIERETYLDLMRQKVAKLAFDDANVHLLRQDLANAKKQIRPDLSAFFARLESLASQEKLSLSGAAADHGRMGGILRRPEFLIEEEPRFWEALFLRLLDFVRSILSAIPFGEPLFLISRILTIICLIGLIAILTYLIWRYTRGAPQGARLPALEVLTEEVLLREPDYYWRLGEKALESEEWRPAARQYFYGILSALHHGGIIRYEISRTNWEYWRMFQNRGRDPEEAHRFHQSIQAYENYLYGNHPVSEGSASTLRKTTKFFLDRFA